MENSFGRYPDGSENWDYLSLTPNSTNLLPAGIKTDSSAQISVFPNPSNGQFTIVSSGTKTIEITDIQGNLVYFAEEGESNVTINLESVSKGIYLIKLLSTNYIYVDKISIL